LAGKALRLHAAALQRVLSEEQKLFLKKIMIAILIARKHRFGVS